MKQDNYEHIAFGDEGEIVEFINKYKSSKEILSIVKYAYPDGDEKTCLEQLESCRSTYDFHAKILAPALDRLLGDTSNGLTFEGVENLQENKSYLYLSNHRDIVLDTTLTNYILLRANKKMTASAIGDNLVNQPFLKDFARVNRNFLVIRGASPRQALQESKLLSSYIGEILRQGDHSVWIAQREGRAKDGDDTTQPGLLKMLGLHADKGVSFLDYIQSLSIVPVAISYEYDATDALKIPSLLAKANGIKYEKSEQEDLQHILAGITQPKGGIHINFGQTSMLDLESLDADLPTNKLVRQVAKRMDSAIFKLYKLWPSNYIAYDMKHDGTRYNSNYTDVEVKLFEERMNKISGAFAADQEQVKDMLLSMYAKPVMNKESIADVFV